MLRAFLLSVAIGMPASVLANAAEPEAKESSQVQPAKKDTLLTASRWKATKQFVFGVNFPWVAFSRDLGRSPKYPHMRPAYDGPQMSRYFEDIRSIGFDVVRIWLMEDMEGWMLNDDQILEEVDPAFFSNLNDLVARARNAGLTLYPCFTTSWERLPHVPSPVKSRSQQDAYIEKAVKPIARQLRGNDTIFAIDIMNEAYSELAPRLGPNQVTHEELGVFLRRNVAAIKDIDGERLVSVSGYVPPKDKFPDGLGLDFFDVHRYHDNGSGLPDVSVAHGRPLFLGEYGQASKNTDDEVQRNAILAFTRNAITKGYAGCFVWSYSPSSKQFRLTTESGGARPALAEMARLIAEKRGRPLDPKFQGKRMAAESVSSAQSALADRLKGTKWMREGQPNNVFEWTNDGRLLQNGGDRKWKVLDEQSVEIRVPEKGGERIDRWVFADDLGTVVQHADGGKWKTTWRQVVE